MGKEASREFFKVLNQIKQFSVNFEEAVDIYTTNSAENFNRRIEGIRLRLEDTFNQLRYLR